MARSRSRSTSKSAKKKKGASAAPPPPPPVLLRTDTIEEYEKQVLQFEGSALVAVVSPICASSTNVIVPFMERLNDTRPPQVKDANLVILYARDTTTELCQHLGISTIPCFKAFSYGELVFEFSGDSTEKVELIGKVAGEMALTELARRAAEKKAAEQAAAAADG